jgi:hypothetical protein
MTGTSGKPEFACRGIWTELFPAEQSRFIQLLVERVQISEAGADITLRTAGLTNLIEDLTVASDRSKDAA